MYVFWMIMIVLLAMLAGPIKGVMERKREKAKEENVSSILKLQDKENTEILIKNVRVDTSQGLHNKFEVNEE